MKNILEALLLTEKAAQEQVATARQQADSLIQQAKDEVQRAEQRFALRIPEIHDAYVDKARQQAKMHIAELERHYDERRDELVKMAEARHQETLLKAAAIILDPQQL